MHIIERGIGRTRGHYILAITWILVAGCATSSDSKRRSEETSPNTAKASVGGANGARARGIEAPELQRELLKMKQRDQRLRKRMQRQSEPSAELRRDLRQLDRKQAERLRDIIESRGRWPGYTLVGEKGSQAAFLIAQHAELDDQLYFKKHFKRAVERGDASETDYAYLVDRIRLRQGQKQLYGTQVTIEGGTVELKPTVDRDELDERRASMGLVPFEQYVERIEKMYDVRESSNPKASP